MKRIIILKIKIIIKIKIIKNYRPITQLSTLLNKLKASVIEEEIQDYLQSNGLVPQEKKGIAKTLEVQKITLS